MADGYSCASHHVCASAIALATPQRAEWLEWRLSQKVRRPPLIPLCLNSTPPKRHEFGHHAFKAAASTRQNLGTTNPPTIHAIFVDDRGVPGLAGMWDIARLANGPGIEFLALLRAPMDAAEERRQKEWSAKSEIGIVSIDEKVLPTFVLCLQSGMARTLHRQSKLRYGNLLKLLLYAILPERVELAVALDGDLVPMRPLAEGLLPHFAAMRKRGAFFGLVAEQSRFYRKGKEANGTTGFNGGLVLHDLLAIRQSGTWGAVLDAAQAGHLFPSTGFSGDQSIYIGVSLLFPHMFYKLPCEWNRQLGSWVMRHEGAPSYTARPKETTAYHDLEQDEEVHGCANRCAMLHANGLKCAASFMRYANASCDHWAALLGRLERGELETGECPDRAATGRMGLTGATWVTHKPSHISQAKWKAMGSGEWNITKLTPKEQAKALGRGYRKWFGDCCRGQALPPVAWERQSVRQKNW